MTKPMTSDTPSQADRAGSEQSALDIAMDALFDVRRAIFNADPNVLTDTLWMPGDTYRGGTVVDFIENEMERVRNARASSAGLGEMIYRALYEPAGGLWSAVDDRYKETVWNAAGHRLAAMLAASPAFPPAEALPERERLWKIIDNKVDALNKLTAERDLLSRRVEWLEKYQRRTYRAALEAAKHWLEEERDSEHPGQTEPNDILKVIDAALGPAEALPSQTSGAEAVERLEAFLDSFGLGWREVFHDDYVGAVRELLNDAALAKPASEPAGGGVTIKPLEWRSHAWGCDADEGRYRIEDNGSNWTDDRYWLFVNVGLLSNHRSKHATLDQAKDAARAHHEARIRSSLSSPASSSPAEEAQP